MPSTLLVQGNNFVEYSTVVMGTTTEPMTEEEAHQHLLDDWGVSEEEADEYIERAKETGSSNPYLPAEQCVMMPDFLGGTTVPNIIEERPDDLGPEPVAEIELSDNLYDEDDETTITVCERHFPLGLMIAHGKLGGRSHGGDGYCRMEVECFGGSNCLTCDVCEGRV